VTLSGSRSPRPREKEDTDGRANGHSRNENHALTGVSTVGDTGFEPVTSSV
jgi:hypothetical protein